MQLKLSKYIDDHVGEMISDLSKLIAIPSVNAEPLPGKPFGEEPAKALNKMLEIAGHYGFTVKNHENYVGTIDMDPEKETKLGVLCHMDVVPEGTGWTNPPYTMTLSGGKLYGRGVADDKGPAIATLFAMRAIRDCGYELTHNVRFIVGSDEETGSTDMEYYRKKENFPPFVFTPDGSYPVINLEKGRVAGKVQRKLSYEAGAKTIISAKAGLALNAVPDRAYATVLGFTEEELEVTKKILPADIELEYKYVDNDIAELTVKGKAAHASQPEGGRNAITALFMYLAALKTEDMSGKFFDDLTKVFPYGETNGEHIGVKTSDEKSGALTLVLSRISFRDFTFTGEFDIRFPICETAKSVQIKMERRLAKEPANLLIADWQGVEPHYVDENSPFVQTLLTVYKEMTNKKPFCLAIGGGTYVHEIEGGVAFGAEFLGEDSRMHGADEFMTLDNLILNTKIYAEAILRICR